jgi:ABC-type lipoprotein release transport system permease subunit
MNEIIIIDPQTVRVLNSIQVASAPVEVDAAAMGLLDAGIDELFELDLVSANETAQPEFSADLLQSFLHETPFDEKEELSGGDWNFIIIRLDAGLSSGAFIAALNKTLAAYGVRAEGWRTAAGTSAMLLLLIQSVFNGGVFLVSVAGILTAINILLISVFRRTREIGTLRAIGASDAYIRFLILTENLVLSLIAGFAGLAGGLCFLRWINWMGIVISNNLIAALLGGAVLKVEALPHIAVLSFAVAAALGFCASVYPVETAVRIDPIAAVRRG